jgi:undecaprenyl-diphosphatase
VNDPRRAVWDDALCRLIYRLGSRDGVQGFFRLVSRLGDGAFWFALMLALPLVWGPDGLDVSVHMVVTGLFAMGLYAALKRHTRRPRPFVRDPEIHARIAPLDEYSFPSGHTLHAVSFTLIAIGYYPALAWVLVPFTLLIAGSRVVLGLHYPSDVVAATLIASGIASISLRFA